MSLQSCMCCGATMPVGAFAICPECMDILRQVINEHRPKKPTDRAAIAAALAEAYEKENPAETPVFDI